MAYRRPGVTVTQEFVGLAPALAAFSLPCVAVGPAYQIVDNDTLGTYTGQQNTYSYASVMGGAVVDLAPAFVPPPGAPAGDPMARDQKTDPNQAEKRPA